MISVAAAKEQIQKSIPLPQPIVADLLQGAGLVLAADIWASHDIPQFEQSSMDGYALAYSEHKTPLHIIGELAAGAAMPFAIKPSEAVRIFTGAPLPQG